MITVENHFIISRGFWWFARNFKYLLSFCFELTVSFDVIYERIFVVRTRSKKLACAILFEILRFFMMP